MMKVFKHIILAVALLLGFAACQEDDMLVFDPENVVNGELAGLQSSYTLTPEDYETTELEFTWAPTTFGISVAANYQLEISTQENNFEYVETLASTKDTSVVINGKDIIAKLQLFKKELGLDIESSQNYVFRIKTSIPDTDEETYSNLSSTSITAFIMSEVALPAEMYIQGSFADWNWDSENLKSMIPVNGTPGAFWMITYFDVDTEFKFSPVKEWGSDFGFPSSDIDFAEYEAGGSNGKITTAGYYMLVVKCEYTSDKLSFTKKILVAKPVVQLMGDTSPAGWGQNESGNFTYDVLSDTWVSPAFVNTDPTKEVRIFTNLSAANIAGWDWWKSEFIVLDGKIAYRGNGGDQARVQGTLGQKVKLNFKDGTGVIE